jgi:gliding motility-associated-like protein
MLKKLALIFLTLSLFFYLNSYCQDLNWIIQGGGTGFDYCNALTVDKDGNTIAVGYFESSANFSGNILSSAGYSDIFLVKYNTNGEMIWIKQIGGKDTDGGCSVSVDAAGNIYVVGSFVGDTKIDNVIITAEKSWNTFVAKFSPSGNLIWHKTIKATDLYSSCRVFGGISSDSNGNSVVSCNYYGTIDFGTQSLTNNNGGNTFVAFFDSNGNLSWVYTPENTTNVETYTVFLDNNDNVYIAGFFTGTIKIGTFVLSATLNTNGDIFFAKLDKLGNPIWAKSIPKKNKLELNNAATGITVSKTGNIYLIGNFKDVIKFDNIEITGINTSEDPGNADIFIAKFSPTGQTIWAKRAGSNSNDFAKNIALDDNENCFITGFYSSDAVFGNINLINSAQSFNMFIAKYDSDGQALNAQSLAIEGISMGNSIWASKTGQLVIGGVFTGKVGQSNGTPKIVIGNGSYNIFIAKIGVNTIDEQEQPLINIPNVFTPNDDGKNDTFVVTQDPKNIQIDIYNRQGIKVFQSNDYKNDWNGDDLPAGVYYYYIDIKHLNKKLAGWVTIIR